MFGLMKVSTHEKAMDAKDAKIADLKLANRTMLNERNAAKTSNTHKDTRIATLETDLAASNEKLRHAEAELAAVKKPARKPAVQKAVK